MENIKNKRKLLKASERELNRGEKIMESMRNERR